MGVVFYSHIFHRDIVLIINRGERSMLKDLSSFIQQYWGVAGAVLFFVSIFFEVSKININPWSSFVKLVTKGLREENKERQKELEQTFNGCIEDVKKQMTSLEEQQQSCAGKMELIQDKIEEQRQSFIDQIEQTQDQIEQNRVEAIKNDDVKEAYRLRWEVLDFADRCKNKSPVTENQFKHIFSEHDRYMAYIEKYGIDNGLEEAEFEYIKQLYFDKFHQKEEED